MKRYIETVTNKNKICLHYTAGLRAQGTLDWWNDPTNPNKNVSAHFVIDRDGSIYQYIPLKYYALHARNSNVSLTSFGIEICCYGFLTKDDNGIYRHWKNGIV